MKMKLLSLLLISHISGYAYGADLEFCVGSDFNPSRDNWISVALSNRSISKNESRLFCNAVTGRGSLTVNGDLALFMDGVVCGAGMKDALVTAFENFQAVGFNIGNDKKGWPVVTGYVVVKDKDCRSGNPL